MGDGQSPVTPRRGVTDLNETERLRSLERVFQAVTEDCPARQLPNGYDRYRDCTQERQELHCLLSFSYLFGRCKCVSRPPTAHL